MISVKEAVGLIATQVPLAAVESRPLSACSGHILRETLTADRALPPYDRVAMDGFAVNQAALQSSPQNLKPLPIEASQRAGEPAKTLKNPASCIKVMTGAVLPHGCDAVIPIEEVSVTNDYVTLKNGRFEKMQNVHQKGSDHLPGSILLEPFRQLLGPQIAIAASIGKEFLQVSELPKIAVVSTGDELVPVGATPLPHQIRSSNAHAVGASLVQWGMGAPTYHHLPDDKRILLDQLGAILQSANFVILSGGVSMGEYDLVPKVLTELGVEAIFHKVRQRPGKPLWFGTKSESNRKCLVFGLPGNPVSALIALHRFVLPALQKSLGMSQTLPTLAYLSEEVGWGKNLTYFLPVTLSRHRSGFAQATPVYGNGSGDFASLGNTSGFLELPESQSIYRPDDIYPFYSWTYPWLY